jgi:hypothetical protein
MPFDTMLPSLLISDYRIGTYLAIIVSGLQRRSDRGSCL